MRVSSLLLPLVLCCAVPCPLVWFGLRGQAQYTSLPMMSAALLTTIAGTEKYAHCMYAYIVLCKSLRISGISTHHHHLVTAHSKLLESHERWRAAQPALIKEDTPEAGQCIRPPKKCCLRLQPDGLISPPPARHLPNPAASSFLCKLAYLPQSPRMRYSICAYALMLKPTALPQPLHLVVLAVPISCTTDVSLTVDGSHATTSIRST